MNVLKRHNFYKRVFIILLSLAIILLIGFAFDIMFIEPFKFLLSETIILSLFLFVIFLGGIDVFLINRTYNQIAHRLSDLSNQEFDLTCKDCENYYKESLFDCPFDHVFSNKLTKDFKDFKLTRFDITFIQSEKSRSYANMYVFKTNMKFSERYYVNHSLFVKNLKKFKFDALGNTNMYYNEGDEIDIKQVDFSSNFFIAFKKDTIYFIDFNKKIFNVLKNLKDETMFDSFVKNLEREGEENYNKVITLR